MIGDFTPWGKRKPSLGWIENERGCHIWTGARTEAGYGVAKVDGRTEYIHCLRYEREVGPVPEGMELDHYACDNGDGGCCNPLHTRPATHRENILRGNSPIALQVGKTHCVNGHPLSGDNLLKPAPSRPAARRCRTCDLTRKRESYRRGAA